MSPLYPPSWLRRINEWLQSLVPNGRERCAAGVLIVAAVLLLTREAILIPVTVGWSAAKSIVESEDELRRLEHEAAEYHAAAGFFATERGKEYARKLQGQYLEDGEHPVFLEPEPDATEPSTARRARDWVAEREIAVGSSCRFALRVLRRWASDPPPAQESPAAARQTPPPTQASPSDTDDDQF